jgi:ATP-dependent Clp protease protease subunit
MVQEKALKTLVFTNRVIGDRVYMLLDKGIGKFKDDPDPYILGSAFAEEMYYWKSQGKQITVKINSPGGSVFEGWSIIDAIRENDAATECIGIAASMAGICLMFGKTGHRSAYNFSRIMIHAPRGGSKEFLDVVKAQFSDLLKSRTKFTETEIKDMIDSGKDYFFNAYEAKEKGIIDTVVETGKTVALTNTSDPRSMYLVYNSAPALQNEFNQTNNTEMEIFNKLFGGKSESENAIAAVQMKAENDALKAEKSAWEAEKKSFEEKIKSLENAGKEITAKQKATELIENAVKAGKLTFKDDSEKAKAIEGATANFDFTKSMIESMPAKKSFSIAAGISKEKNEQLTYEWLTNNDPEKLKAIYNDDRELFDKLSNEYIASEKAKKENANK